jgi:hypothetical protein
MVRRCFAAIGLALLVLVAGVGCDQGPGTAATSAMRAGAAGDAETLRKYLPRDVLEQARQLPGDMVARLATMMKSGADRRGGLKSLTIVSEKVEGDRATVHVKAVWGDGREETDEIGLIRSDGRWVLDLMPGRI